MNSARSEILRAWSAGILSCVVASAVVAAPPKVIKAAPDNGQREVDPATKWIRVVFDQPMDPGGFSWVGGGEKFPKTVGKPRWVDNRTCVLNVQLEPNHDYWLSINSDRFTNFRSKTGEPAEPYPIEFKTGAGKAGATTRPAATRPAATRPARPRVVEATPDNGQAVDPGLGQLRIVFDQPMTTGENYSLVGGGDSFPKILGKPRWENDRTLVCKWQLEPDHEYWLSINSERFTGFRSKKSEPAEPYAIEFKTGAGKGGPSTRPTATRPARPRVVKATPDNGQANVEPGKGQLRIVFDQPMTIGKNYSLVGGGDTFPKIVGQPRWENDRTLVCDWELEPDHEYWLSINSERFTGFRSKTGRPAEPYPIEFKTGAGKGGATEAPGAAGELTPETNRQAIAELRQAIDKDYSYRDLHKLDWDALFKDAGPRLEAAKTPLQFAREAGKMLAANKDLHLWLKVGEAQVPSFRRDVQPNCSRAELAEQVPGFAQRNNIVATGRFLDGIGYILIASWDSRDPELYKAAYEALAQCDESKGLIVDVRPNGGGSELMARGFAGCFLDRPTVYAKHVTRQDGQFSEVQEREFSPNEDGPKYRGKVAVLTGQAVMSSNESFLLMMKQVPNCKLIGETSYGSSGNPQPVELSNGVTLFLPCWKDLRLDGSCFEGEGIAPDIEVKTRREDFANADPVLAAALKWLRGNTSV